MQVVRLNPILCCIIPRDTPHFFVSPSAIPDNRCLTECDFIRENLPSSGQVVDLSNLSVKPHLFTDKLSILSQPFTVIGSWWRAGQPRTAKS
jgi:hypothetical protein